MAKTTRDYREIRVYVSKDIKNTLFDLIKDENDIEKKKKHPAIWYREKVADKLELTENSNPSLRSYEDAISDLRDFLRKKDPVDKLWSIGACIKNDIPSIDIPLLVEIGNARRIITLLSGCKYFLTIREAKWISKLRPICDSLYESLDIKGEPPNPKRKIGFLMLLAPLYAKCEQMAQANDESFPDTSGLDDLFFKVGNTST